MSSKKNRFLENIQGLLIYLDAGGHKISLSELLNRGDDLEYLVDQYNQNHEEVLSEYFKKKELEPTQLAYFALLDYFREQNIDPNNLTNIDPNIIENKLLESYSMYESIQEKLPTKYQSISIFYTHNPILENLITSAEYLEYKLPSLVLGTVSTGSVNACAIALEDNEAVVILEEDMASFIHLFCKIFALCVPVVENGVIAKQDEIIQTVKENNDVLVKFKDFMKSYVIDGSPRESEQYYLPFDESDPRYQLCTYMMLSINHFIIGHELGHIIAGHQKEKRKIIFFNEANDISYNKSNWEKEYEADIIGMNLSIQAMMMHFNFMVDFGYLGVELFFVVYEIATKAFKIIRDGNEEITMDYKSHPNCSLRIENTRTALRSSLNEEDYLTCIYLPDVFKETFDYLWENTKHVFYEEYESRQK